MRSRNTLLRWPTRLARAVSCLALTTFSASFAQPTIAALRDDGSRGPTRPHSELQEASDQFVALERLLDRMDRRLQGRYEFDWQEIAARVKPVPAPAAASRNDLVALDAERGRIAPRLDALQLHLKNYFDESEQHLISRRAPAAAIEQVRHRGEEYEMRYAELSRRLKAIDSAVSAEDYRKAVAEARAYLKANSSQPSQAESDPRQLAFGSPGHKARAPISDGATLRRTLGFDGTLVGEKSAPQMSDTAATTDVQLTPDIIAKANELNRQPLPIFNWVRNNVEFMPTYGSIQGSQNTLKALRGNAFDQASLLIALLRASNIQARYVYGTVEVPIAQVNNWVGGTTTPEAALQLLGQGGVPSVGIVEGGAITRAQIEHVWVEAYVDYVPSRGARHVTGDTWIALDPSFKQYAYTAPLDYNALLPFDAAAADAAALSGATVNESAGWVQNFNFAASQALGQAHATALVAQIDAGDYTVGQLIGSKTITAQNPGYLAATLPYPVTAVGQRLTELPDSLRWKFEYLVNGTTLYSQALPGVIGNDLSLAASPATPADEQVFASYMPQAADGMDDLPTQMPAGVANVRLEFAVNGEVVSIGAVVPVAQNVAIAQRLFQPGHGWTVSNDVLAAGDYQAVMVDGVGLNVAKLEEHRLQWEAFQRKLADPAHAYSNKHDIPGLELRTALSTYFAQTNADLKRAAAMSDVATYRMPSFGTASTRSDVLYWMGIPTSIGDHRLNLDISHVHQATFHKGGNVDRSRQFNRFAGRALSAAEYAVPLALSSTTQAPATPISAMSALPLAAVQGQKIYEITSANLNSALAAMQQDPAMEASIAAAVAAGYRVTTHEAPVDHLGRATAGYIVEDPTTGAGAYKLADGSDGAFWNGVLVGHMMMLFVLMAFWIPFLAPFFIFAAIMFLFSVYSLSREYQLNEAAHYCFVLGLMTPIGTTLACLLSPLTTNLAWSKWLNWAVATPFAAAVLGLLREYRNCAFPQPPPMPQIASWRGTAWAPA